MANDPFDEAHRRSWANRLFFQLVYCDKKRRGFKPLEKDELNRVLQAKRRVLAQAKLDEDAKAPMTREAFGTALLDALETELGYKDKCTCDGLGECSVCQQHAHAMKAAHVNPEPAAPENTQQAEEDLAEFLNS